MSSKVVNQICVEGSVAPGFESIKQMFEHNMSTMAEENAQLCIYVGEDKVVDLWASASGDADFNADSLINVFSSGKSLEAIAIASLVGKGLLTYEAKITDYWPEFGAKGKAELTVADLLRHEAGLAAFDVSIETTDLLKENIKLNSVGRVIESQTQKYRKGEDKKREYHAVTRGWIVNEVFRRVDPEGRTMGEFLRADISGALDVDAVIGVHESELGSIARVSPLGISAHLWESLKPKFFGRKVKDNIFQIVGKLVTMIPSIRQTTTAGAPAPIKGLRIEKFSDPAFAMGETPSAGAHCTARGLAKIAAAMATGGSWAGTEVISEAAWHAMHDEPIKSDMGIRTTFTQGGVALFPETTPACSKMECAANQGREGFYGWMGLGGSVFQWHPEKKIGFGFVPTSLHLLDFVNERAKTYQAETLNCLNNQ